jgi:hypothetical protein
VHEQRRLADPPAAVDQDEMSALLLQDVVKLPKLALAVDETIIAILYISLRKFL